MDKSTIVKTLIGSLEKSQWYTPELMQEKQLIRLAQIISHSFESVGFYRPFFEACGYQAGQSIKLDFLYSLPILTREEVQNGQEENLRSTALQTDDYSYPIVTSGSTGVAVRLIGTFDTACYWQALSMREHLWHKRDFNKTLAAIRWAKPNEALAPLGEPNSHWGKVTEGLITTGPSFFLNVATSTQEQIKWLQMIKPHYLLSYPSQLKVILQTVLDKNISIQNLSEIRCLGETVDQELLSLSAYVNLKLTDVYSSEEFGIIAIQCPEYYRYHIQSENVIVEIINEANNPCAIDEEGRVLVTSLHNFATPLFRYEIGDYAAWDKPCACGRDALPTLKKISGRKRNRLILPNGESQFPYLGDREQYRQITHAVKKFQMIQHDHRTVECKLMVEEPLTSDQQTRYAKLIEKNLGHGIKVKLSFHKDIPRQSNGKFEEFISLVSSNS